MPARLRSLAALCLAAACTLHPAAAQPPDRAVAPAAASVPARGERLALVIGNGAYKDAPLPNPVNDAADVARALEASGFTVIRRENATLREMHLALREFGDRLGRSSTGLFYFAGHGLQVRGRNYLVPVDADIAREDEVAFAALDLAAVLEKLDSARNPVNLVVLDACRNDPFGKRFQPTARGLAQVDAPPGTFIAFATAPGSVAADGLGRNGLYTSHLLREMRKPGAPIEEVFKSVRAAVRKDSAGRQVPWESTSLESAFSFVDAPPPPPPKALAQAPAGAASTAKRPASAAKDAAGHRAMRATGAAPEFAVGDSWTYRSLDELSGRERTYTVKVTKVDANQVHYGNGAITDRTGNHIRSISATGVASEFHPPAIWYVFPMVPGASLNTEHEQRTGGREYTFKVTLKVTGEEEIETPAGRFRAIRSERRTEWRQRDSKRAGTLTSVLWYSGAVKRFVRIETTNTTVEGKALVKERTELERYAVR